MFILHDPKLWETHTLMTAIGPVEAMQACRSMWQGFWKLFQPWRLRPGHPDTSSVKWLQPLKGMKMEEDETLRGSLPHRAMALAVEANDEELSLKLQWEGAGQMKCVCLLMAEDGKLLGTLWEGHSEELGLRYHSKTPSYHEDTDDEDEDTVLLGDQLSLRLGQVSKEVFALAVVLVGSQAQASWASADVLSHFQELTLSLRREEQRLWKYRQRRLRQEANALCSCIFYRGPGRTWRMEPMNMAMLLMHLNEVQATPSFAVSEIARFTALKLRWMVKVWCKCCSLLFIVSMLLLLLPPPLHVDRPP
ncbi:unnamed protein product [Durusdinium trenchii]|uniref:Uncharacterized protein n=1 Tax=Durusdinium trenchii TaxID=1381693 RepID=A0ABP0PAV6_9DINO